MTDKELLDQFMPWISKWANKCQHISKYIDFDDLQSVGMMAVFEGRDNFVEGKGTKLNTHIMNMVKFRILREANSGQEWKLSQNNHILAIKKARRLLGEDATPEEISVWMKGHYADKASMLSPSTIRELEEVSSTKHSSIQGLQEREDVHPDRYMPTTEVDFEGDLDEKMRLENLYECIPDLNDQQRHVMYGRLKGKTLEVISNEMNLTRERIRQIEFKSIILLKKMLNMRDLRNENSITNNKRDNNNCNRGDLRRPGNRPQEESPIDSGSSGDTYRPGGEIADEPKGFFKERPYVIFEQEYKLAPYAFKLLQYLKNTEERRKLHLAKAINCTQRTVYSAIKELKDYNIVNEYLTIQDPKNWSLYDSGREIQSSADTLWRGANVRQNESDRTPVRVVDEVREEPISKLQSPDQKVESSDMEVFHRPPKRRERAVHIPKVQERSDDRSDVPNVTIGQKVCEGLYEVLDIIIPGLKYEVLILATGKHTVLKASEIY